MSHNITLNAMRIERSARRLLNGYAEHWTCFRCHWTNRRHLPNAFEQSRRWNTTRAPTLTSRKPLSLQGLEYAETQAASPSNTKQRSLSQLELRAVQRLDVLLQDSQDILLTKNVPTESTVLEALKTCRRLSEYFGAIKEQPALSTIKPGGEAGNLLFLETDASDGHAALSQPLTPTAIGRMASSIAEEAMDKIAEAVQKIAKDKDIYITSKILQEIVDILSMINRPDHLAQIFILYASKPAPQPNSSPVKYTTPNPDRITAAIPLPVAEKALDAAIKAQNLALCLDIADHSVRTTAYKRAKVVRKAFLPGAAVAMTPFASYIIASRIAEMQEAMSATMMTTVGMAGLMTYIGATGTIGFIAMATANDQMQRVTWASGMHLRQRWLREDERAFMDKIVCAWGFADPYRRGEEEGPEWEALKELCGIRGMVLDRVELMEGMQ